MTPKELLAQKRAALTAKLAERNDIAKQLAELRGTDDVDPTDVTALRTQKDNLDAEIDQISDEVRELQDEIARDAKADELSRQSTPTDAKIEAPQGRALVISEERTYNPGNDKNGEVFLADILRAAKFNDPAAAARLERHMQEERVERGEGFEERAVGSGAFAGLVVPQYLVDLVAPTARAGRPLANVMRHHDLPEKGMTVEISRVTTGTSASVQSAENAAASETGIDDTVLSVPIRTVSGAQTVSLQAAQRGTGVLDTVLGDLVGAHNTSLDGSIISTASVGLSALATAVTYTDASPTAAEAYPKIIAAQAATEAALLDQSQGDIAVVMHSRRWNWLTSQMTTTWPFIGQPGIAAQQGGTSYAEAYGKGFRGILPNGALVVVDNNIATNLGSGTNEDEIYVIPLSESHIWEDPNAPLFIRADQPNAKGLGIDLVVYSFFAFTFGRYPSAIQKVGGTGLAAPTF